MTQSSSLPKRTVLNMFGLTGDWGRNRLLPSIVDNFFDGRCNNLMAVRSFQRSQKMEWLTEAITTAWNKRFAKLPENTEDERRAKATLKENFPAFLSLFKVVPFDVQSPASFAELARMCKEDTANYGTTLNSVTYVALPPNCFIPFCNGVNQAGLQEFGDTKFIFEKPADILLSAQLPEAFKVKVLVNDHYAFYKQARSFIDYRRRTTNRLLRGDAQFIEVTVLFNQGLVQRRYLAETGIGHDMISHLLYFAAIAMMNQPTDMSAGAFRAEVLKALKRIRRIERENAVYGQWTATKDFRDYQDECTTLGFPCDKESYAAYVVHTVKEDGSKGEILCLRTGKHAREIELKQIVYTGPPEYISGGENDPNSPDVRAQTGFVFSRKDLHSFEMFECVPVLELDPVPHLRPTIAEFTPRQNGHLGPSRNRDACTREFNAILSGDYESFLDLEIVEEQNRIFSEVLVNRPPVDRKYEANNCSLPAGPWIGELGINAPWSLVNLDA